MFLFCLVCAETTMCITKYYQYILYNDFIVNIYIQLDLGTSFYNLLVPLHTNTLIYQLVIFNFKHKTLNCLTCMILMCIISWLLSLLIFLCVLYHDSCLYWFSYVYYIMTLVFTDFFMCIISWLLSLLIFLCVLYQSVKTRVMI
jgi:hypothetical protein